jgi:hypothetical protein
MSTISSSTLTTIDSILKIDYKDPIVELLNSKTLLVHRIEATTEYTSGKRAYMPLHISRNEGVGARAEYAGTAATQLPSPGAQGFSDASYEMTYQYGRCQFTGPAIAAARDNEGSFARLVETEMMGLVRDIGRDQNRQLFGPKSGALGYVTALTTPASGIVTMDNVSHVRVGMLVDIIDESVTGTVLNVATFSVGAVDSSTNQVTFNRGGSAADLTGTDVSAAVAIGDFPVRRHNYVQEMFGLIDLISDVNPTDIASGTGTYQEYVGGINRATVTHDLWDSNVVNHNAQFSETIFQDQIDLSEREGDGDISIFITTYAIFNEYGNSLLPDRRFNTDGGPFGKLDGGWDALYYNGRPVVKDRDCQEGNIWGLDEMTLKLLMMADWDWMDKDGAVLSRIANADAYEATLFSYREFATNAPRRSCRHYNVNT